ncbi:MAG TPA: hypothetical protein PLA19_05305 [Candidatus Pacearchaeota archaeon]|nr:hypothetical protein [Candidatus Pacearchaeota archaeon]
MKYILTKHETIKRTEKIQYEIEIPKNIIYKTEYANNQVAENNYQSYKIIDIVNSETIDDEIVALKIKSN